MIYHVYANQKNIGDWLSGQAIQSMLGAPAVKELFCDEPFVPETIAALNQATTDDLVIIGGGGLFMDYFVPFWEGFRPLADRLKFCIWGVGYCDLKRQVSRAPENLLTEIVRRCALCVARDELTRQHLAECHLPAPVCCPTINLVQTTPPGNGMLHVDAWGEVGAENYEFMQATGKDFAGRTGRTFNQLNNEIHPARKNELARALEKYASADLILTARLHGCIIGLAMGRKVLAVSCDRKIESFMQAAGLSDWVLELKDLRQKLPARLEALPTQPDVARFIAEVRKANRAVAGKVKALAAGRI